MAMVGCLGWQPHRSVLVLTALLILFALLLECHGQPTTVTSTTTTSSNSRTRRKDQQQQSVSKHRSRRRRDTVITVIENEEDDIEGFKTPGKREELHPARMSCDASYSAPCARQNSEWLAMKTAKDLNEALLSSVENSISLEQAWQVINDGGYNFETNFYPFVLEKKTGILMAHGASTTLVGMTMAQVVETLGIGFFNVDYLLENFVEAANSPEGGGWVEYFWGAGGMVKIKTSFATNITDDYMVAVGYNSEPLPPEPNCNADFDSWCSLTNVRSLVGQAQFLLSGAQTLGQFEKGAYEMSFDVDEYQISKGFYIFMYNYDGSLISHARLHQEFGMSLADIFVQKKLGTHEEGEQLHQNFISAAEGFNGGWIQYPWRNVPEEEPFTKVAYIIKIVFQENSYYLGVGFTFRSLAHYYVEDEDKPAPELPQLVPPPPPPEMEGTTASASAVSLPINMSGDATTAVHKSGNLSSINISGTSTETSTSDPSSKPPSPSPNDADEEDEEQQQQHHDHSTCTDKHNLPCAFRTSLHLSSHAMTHAISSPLSVDEIWSAISHHPSFRANDFYIYAYDFNGTLVAHGAVPDYIGMTMQQIYDKANIEMDVTHVHHQFRQTAKEGGGWVIYDWRVPGTKDTFLAKIAYLWSINIGPRRYYAGVGFYHERAPIATFAEIGTKMNGDPILCSSKYDLQCSLNNAKALVGQAAAELTLVSSQVKVRVTEQRAKFKTREDVLTAITNRDPTFTFNDFNVSVWYVDGTKCPDGGGDGRSGCCLAHAGNPDYVNKTWDYILSVENITSIPAYAVHGQLTKRAGGVGGPWNYSYSGTVGMARTKKAITTLVECGDGDMYVLAEYFGTPQPPTCDKCPDNLECTEPTQEYCEYKKPDMPTTPFALLLAVPLVMILSLCFVLWYKRRNWKKRQVLAQKIKQMEKQMKDMVEIVHDIGMQVVTAQDYKDKFGHVGVGAVTEQVQPKVQVAWYWEESQRLIGRHHSSRIMPGERFVKYLEVSSNQIERAYQRWKEGKGFKEFRLDLTGKINKFDSQASGAQYVIDFEEMTQRNIWSDYSREIRREQHVEAKLDLEIVNRLPPLPKDIDFFGKDGEDFLPTYPGQVIQVSKEHPSEQWLYGSVLYDPLLADAQNSPQGVAATEGLNRVLAMALHDRPTSGWFPAALSKPADVKVMQQLVESLGGEGVTNLKPPGRWKPHKDGCINVEKGSAEYEEVVHYFLAALYEQRDHVSVVGVERIQSMPLWQSYAVKKETMRTRDAKYPENLVNNQSGTVERRWLFHGTTGEVIPKIVKQGFNRAFAGRNAVAFGKGVYFARDAAYSSHQSYSTPDSNGIQRMFLCRVAVGDWCKGNNGQLTPDPKPRNQMELFDSTVDDVSDPTIFVVYHDAQAYPDYLVAFRRHDEESD